MKTPGLVLVVAMLILSLAGCGMPASPPLTQVPAAALPLASTVRTTHAPASRSSPTASVTLTATVVPSHTPTPITTATASPTPSITPHPTTTPTWTPSPTATPAPHTVVFLVFHDYNGNGTRESEEPLLQGISLATAGRSCITGPDGACQFDRGLAAGKYTLAVSDPTVRFRYILPSVKEFRSLQSGLPFVVSGNSNVPVPLGEGFLTLPFAKGTLFIRSSPFGLASVFDLDPNPGSAIGYREDILPAGPAERPPWVVDGHTALDFCIEKRTPILAAMPGRVTYVGDGIQHATDKFGGKGLWICGGGYANYYNHLDEILVRDEQLVQRGEVLGYSGNTGTEEPHLHFENATCATPPLFFVGHLALDPYATDNPHSPNQSPGFWTVRNAPQYSR